MTSTLTHKTWWGEAFVSALKAYIDPGRLQRGKAYRTDNRVLEFKIQGNEIKATIRGNINAYFGVTKEPRYKVVLKFDPISPKQWQGIIKNICDNALWLSKLMLNEIPSDIESAFGRDSLLPASYQDVETGCSCPDYSDPCKHIAGVYYRIASLLDSNPMLLFQLRGLTPKELHQELKKTELGQAFSEHLTLPETVDMEYQSHKYTVTQVKRVKTKQTINVSQFWSMPASVDLVDEVDLDANAVSSGWPALDQSSDKVTNICAALIKKQGDYPEFWKNNNSFIDAMELFYNHTRKKNQKDLF